MNIVAVDLGASSLRVFMARVDRGSLQLTELLRVPNKPVLVRGTLQWNVLSFLDAVVGGLAGAGPDVASVGIDSWAVDYGLLDETGALLGNPVHYRDARTEGMVEPVLADIGAERLYATTGIQVMQVNTIFQLAAARVTPQLAAARHLLLLPDLIAYWLTGEIGAEATNASTTQLFDLHTENWAYDIIAQLGLPERIFPPLRRPGERVGIVDVPGIPAFPVTAVGSHDTASAVVGVPAVTPRFAYISCGTWSLVGVELDKPVLSADSRAENFTNERGVDGTIRYLRNVMGLWLLQESLREWGCEDELAALLTAAANEPAFGAVVNPDDPAFLAPGDMPARIVTACRRTGQRPPRSRAAFVRCIVESLALAHGAAVRAAAKLSGRDIDVIHIVGGGSQNELLCQLTADACGIPVLAGPVEATAVGNVLVQARSLGIVGDLGDVRRLIAETQPVRRYQPRGSDSAWSAAGARIGL